MEPSRGSALEVAIMDALFDVLESSLDKGDLAGAADVARQLEEDIRRGTDPLERGKEKTS